MRGIGNLIIGGVMVVGGLSGNLVLKGTQSGGALAVLGGVLCCLGVYRLGEAQGVTVHPERPGAVEGRSLAGCVPRLRSG